MTVAIVEKYIKEHYLPSRSQMVNVMELWDNRYRVNIWDFDPNRITASYFIRVSEGKVSQCSPQISA